LIGDTFKEKLFSHNYEMNNNTRFAVIAIVSALALFGVVMVTVAVNMQLQEAEAIGCINPNAPGGGSIAVNASQGRCIR
jgi:hypothetical protein